MDTTLKDWKSCVGDIPPEERTPAVERLLRILYELREENRRLRDEIDRLKGQTTRPQINPSRLNEQGVKDGRRRRKKRKGKRPGSAKRAKTRSLKIDQTRTVHPENLPPGAVLEGYKTFVVQDLVIGSDNTLYRRARYVLPDGSRVTAPLPRHVEGHFGAALRAHVLYQHYQNHVTQPLIHEELLELGVDISAGQINRILTEGHEAFHQEKEELLPAGLAVSGYIHTDDTSARHQGRNGYTTHLGNEFFASFSTTESKSRINFLKILQAPCTDYMLDGDALFFMECYGLSVALRDRLERELDGRQLIFPDEASWERWLEEQEISSGQHRRIVTESALLASILHHEVLGDLVLISDDAGQFHVLGVLHALCWVHAERWVDKLVPLNARERQAKERVQDEIWKFYQRLKAYRESPTGRQKTRLSRQFDRLFTQRTGFVELNEALQRIREKKELLLLVLERPEIPLHNNLSENDIRDFVKKRKISAGTRSDLGRRCRDTFLSLKKTCRKLGVSFWRYLHDRLRGEGAIPPLWELVRKAAQPP